MRYPRKLNYAVDATKIDPLLAEYIHKGEEEMFHRDIIFYP